MIRSRFEPFFLETSSGRIFLLLRAPIGAKRCVLFVPPFAEEMNKCRRQVTETAEALVSAGSAALVLDLFGTGDSAGDFRAATWEVWKDNVAAAISWAAGEDLPIASVVAMRLGCILASEALIEAQCAVTRTVFWQPVESGRQFMTQFLRLRVAASMMSNEGGETVEGLKARLSQGEALAIAGYALTPALWQSIESLELLPLLSSRLGKLAIFEVGRAREGKLSVSSRRLLQAATDRGTEASGVRLPGEPFWSSTEIVTDRGLTRQTVAYLESVG